MERITKRVTCSLHVATGSSGGYKSAPRIIYYNRRPCYAKAACWQIKVPNRVDMIKRRAGVTSHTASGLNTPSLRWAEHTRWANYVRFTCHAVQFFYGSLLLLIACQRREITHRSCVFARCTFPNQFGV